MLPEPLKTYPELALPHVRKMGLFIVRLVPGQLIDKRQLGKARRWNLVKTILQPALAGAQYAYLYPDDGSQAFSSHTRLKPGFLIPNGNRYRIDVNADVSSESNREFWIDWDWNRGSMVWKASKSIRELQPVLEQCYDPVAISNPSVYLDPNAIRLVKRRVEKEAESIWLGLPSGIEALFFFSHPAKIENVFKTVLHHCQFTPAFKTSYASA